LIKVWKKELLVLTRIENFKGQAIINRNFEDSNKLKFYDVLQVFVFFRHSQHHPMVANNLFFAIFDGIGAYNSACGF